jgi:hypothetical protein
MQWEVDLLLKSAAEGSFGLFCSQVLEGGVKLCSRHYGGRHIRHVLGKSHEGGGQRAEKCGYCLGSRMRHRARPGALSFESLLDRAVAHWPHKAPSRPL